MLDISIQSDKPEFRALKSLSPESCVRVYTSSPDRVALQVRGVRGSHRFIAHVELTQNQFSELREALRKVSLEKWGIA